MMMMMMMMMMMIPPNVVMFLVVLCFCLFVCSLLLCPAPRVGGIKR